MSDQSPPYDISSYKPEELYSLLTNHTEWHLVKDKTHLDYLREYLEDKNAKTVIVETHYIDHDYLEDFSSYYIRCFADYKRICRRIHFFCDDISEENFKSYLAGEETGKLQEHYLGFIVIKPLPKTVIGKTCLKTYNDDEGRKQYPATLYNEDEGRRQYPATRNYDVNLFGIKLLVSDTLAFQEQDRVASACATSALWSVFQATSKKFGHSLSSPVVITESATKHLPVTSRSLPNNGLTLEQMAYAVRSVGLEPNLVEAKQNPSWLKAQSYAYLKAGIPLIMIIDLFKTSELPNVIKHGNDRHAVAVTGYSLGYEHVTAYNSEINLQLKSSLIDKFYVHDDQVGPFSRMEFENINVFEKYLTLDEKDTDEVPLTILKSSLKPAGGSRGDLYTQWDTLLIPLYHKIRIPFLSVLLDIMHFDKIVEDARQADKFELNARLVWDIYLTTVNDVKSEIRETTLLSAKDKEEFLCRKSPKYLWRATALDGKNKIIDLYFDATDIEQGSYFSQPIIYDVVFAIKLSGLCRGYKSRLATVNNLTDSVIAIIDYFSKYDQ